jgi:DNA polymerase-3 subunit alpha
MSQSFVHLHNHSHYSLGDAISQIPQIFDLAQSNNMPAVALTDHGNLFGAAEFFLEAKKHPNINAILGCEIYLTHHDMRSRDNKALNVKPYHHLVLLVQNEQGYKNLSKMVSLSYEEGFYYRPRIDFALLEQHAKGLVASSACLGGEIASLLLQGNFGEAKKRAFYFQELFGKDNFFLEIMYHGENEQETVAKEIVKLSKDTGIPLIATNDVHYPFKGDDEAHDIFLCIASGNKKTDQKRKRYPSKEFYFKNYEQMKEAVAPFSLEAIHNTTYVANLCHYAPNLDEFQLPCFETPSGVSAKEYLRKQCEENITTFYSQDDVKAKERLAFELETIEKMGFSSYFLIVQDFINYAKNNNIAVGPGRGSVAGSIVSYLLGITSLDPLQYNLLFERFLNPGRISMPDIDTDFDDTKRDEVIEYVAQKYGKDRVAQIVTFGRLKAKMVIRDVGRVLDIPLSEIDSLSKLIPPFTSLKKTYDEVSEFKQKINSSPLFLSLYETSRRLENLVRHTSVHAAGVIIGKTSLYETVPLYKDNKTGNIVTQFEGKYLEEFGLLKMDFLGLRNLRIIQNTLSLIKQSHGKDLDLNKISLDDSQTYQIYQQGKGVGIFQCESSGIIELMKKLSPTRFQDIIALLALYRPGPLNSGMAEAFVKNKANPKNIIYPHKNLHDVLEDTYGVIIYQEQIMQISQIVAGFSLAEADNLRKAMGKKDLAKMDSMKNTFIKGAIKHGYDEFFAKDLFGNMAKFAEYGFNKSHSAAYALISYQTAYLKAHYPIEYMCCVLNGENLSIEHLATYLKECKDLGIKILPPHINKSGLDFSVEKEGIRFGFSAIKNVGNSSMKIIAERDRHGEFSSFFDLIKRIGAHKKIMEFLTISGALDEFVPNRATVIANLEKLSDYFFAIREDEKSGMKNLFEDNSEGQTTQSYEFQMDIKEEYDQNTLFSKEKEILGFYASGHPLGHLEDVIKNSPHLGSVLDIREIRENIEDGIEKSEDKTFQLLGRVFNPVIKTTKNNDKMAIYTFEDLYSEIPLIVFPKTYEKFQEQLRENTPLLITCKVDFSKKDFQAILLHMKPFNENVSAPPFTKAKEPIKAPLSEVKTSLLIVLKDFIDHSHLFTLQQNLKKSKGKVPVILEFQDNGKNIRVKVDKEFFIQKTEPLLRELKDLFFIKEVQFLN